MITEVSFDILRQGTWDLWCWLCLLATAALLLAAETLLRRRRASPRRAATRIARRVSA